MPGEHRDREPPEQFIVKSMPEILADLALYEQRKKMGPEYQVAGRVESVHLQALLNLSHEVALTEQDGKLILTPLMLFGSGVEEPDAPYSGYFDRQTQSRLWAHTHNRRTDGILVDTPSFQDFKVAKIVNTQTDMLVIHGRGITRFGKIRRHPVTGAETTSTSELIHDYEQQIGARLQKFDKAPNQPFIGDKYTFEEITQLAKEFTKNSGMLLDEAEWSDNEGIERLLKILNLKK